MKRFIIGIALLALLVPSTSWGFTLHQGEITSTALGVPLSAVAAAQNERQISTTVRGTLVEIGNTSNRYTTVVLRVISARGESSDETIEITPTTSLRNSAGQASTLNDWIAGDQLTIQAIRGEQSGYYRATRITNSSINRIVQSVNGWVTALDGVTNKISLSGDSQVTSLDLTGSRLVVGNQNPALLFDFRVGDRIRARVKKTSTNQAQALIVVALRRGDNLFMRTTRWIIPATITEIPSDLTLPLTIQVRAMPSRFYQEGDINNIFGSSRALVSVVINDQTDLKRAYRGNLVVTELVEGDNVSIVGRWDELHHNFIADTVRDQSVQLLGSSYLYAQVSQVDLERRTVTAFAWQNDHQTENWTLTFDDDSQFYREKNPFFAKDLLLGSIVRLRLDQVSLDSHRAHIQKLVVMSDEGRPLQALPLFPGIR